MSNSVEEFYKVSYTSRQGRRNMYGTNKGSCMIPDSLMQTKGGVVYGRVCHAYPIPVMPHPLIARIICTHAYTGSIINDR